MKLEKYYRNKDKKIESMAKINLYQFICHDFSFVVTVIPDRDIISFDGSSQTTGFLYFLQIVWDHNY